MFVVVGVALLLLEVNMPVYRVNNIRPPRWPSGKASASRVEGPGFESRLHRDFFGVKSYQ